MEPSPDNLDELLTTIEAARLLRVHPGTIRRWLLSGRLPGWRKGGRLAVCRRDLQEFLQPAGRPVPKEPHRSTVSARTRRELERLGFKLPKETTTNGHR